MAGMVSMGITGDPNRKYNLQQQQIDLARDKFNQEAQTMALQRQLMPDQAAAENYARRGTGFAAFGQGNLSNANAKLAPDLAQSEIGLRGAQASNLRSTANATDTQASLAPGVSSSENALRAAQAGNFDVMGMLQRLQAQGLGQDMAPVNPAQRNIIGQRFDTSTSGLLKRLLGFAAGTSHVDPHDQPMHPSHRAQLAQQLGYMHPHEMQGMAAGDSMVGDDMGMDMDVAGMAAGGGTVPGGGDGTVDTVNAKLAGGEAVLNKAAADFLGRDLIDKVNQAGAIAMGLDQKPNQPRMQPADGAGTPATEPAQPGQQMPGMAAGAKKVPPQKAAAGGKEAPRKGPPAPEQPGKAKSASAKPAAKGKGKPMDAKMPDMTQMIAQMMGGMG